MSLSAETNGYSTGNASTGISTGGHTPTVAMARRETLARFLEKRLHRMNQTRTSHLMGNHWVQPTMKRVRQRLPETTRRRRAMTRNEDDDNEEHFR